MTVDPAIPGFLGRALSLEMTAVQQYLAMAKLLELRGMGQAGTQFRQEAVEEMEHADRIIGRMLAMGFAPAATRLRPARLEGSLPHLLQHASRLEQEIVSFYAQAVTYCGLVQDHENRLFFHALLQEEQQHATGIDEWLRNTVGDQATRSI